MNFAAIVDQVKNFNIQDVIAYLKGLDRKTWIKIGIASVIFIVVIVLFIYPAWIGRLSVHKKVNNLQMQITGTKALLGQEKELTKTTTDLAALTESITKRLYKPDESTKLLGVISRFAQECQVSVVASNPKEAELYPPPFDAQYAPFAYGLTLEGTYDAFGCFAAQVENNSEILRIHSFYVRPQEKNEKHFGDLTITSAVRK